MKKLATAVALVVLGLTLTGCASNSGSGSDRKPRLETALTSCHLSPGSDGIELGDKKTSLVLDTEGEEDASGLQAANASCVLKATKITDADMNLVESTRALDGRQQASWNGYDATWSYHPDTGLNMTLVDNQK